MSKDKNGKSESKNDSEGEFSSTTVRKGRSESKSDSSDNGED